MATVPDTIDIPWNSEFKLCMIRSDGPNIKIRVPNLFGQGALFVFGRNWSAQSAHPKSRVLFGARFELDDRNTVNNIVTQARSTSLNSAVLLLPDTDGMIAYATQLRELLGSMMFQEYGVSQS